MQIHIRNILIAFGLIAFSLFVSSCHNSEVHTKQSKPNFIIIMADDLGYGDLGCYGGKHARTPCIDALAAGGMKFTDFHSNGAVCSPTRAALITGRYQQRSGINGVITAKNHRHTGLALQETSFAEVLKSSGYTTALFGKWHLGYQVDFNPVQQGFDSFAGFVSGNIDYKSHFDQAGHEDWWQGAVLKPEEGYSTYLIAQHGLRFLEKHKNQPFCLYLAHEAPHYPFQGPDDPPYRKAGHGKPVVGIRKDRRNAYFEMIEAMDKTVGQIVDKVQELGLDRNTIIFFCSDNGGSDPESNGGLRGRKGTLWEGGHRVPAIAYWPGKIAGGIVTDETAMSMDLFPTMCDLAEADLPTKLQLDGVSLAPLMLKNQQLPERNLFWQHRNQKAIRCDNWKLLVSMKGSNDNGTYLFNIADDMAEKNNVIEHYPEKVNELIEALRNFETDVSQGVQKRS